MRIKLLILSAWLTCLLLNGEEVVQASSLNTKTLMITQVVASSPSYATSFNAYTSNVGYTAATGLSLNITGNKEVSAAGIAQVSYISENISSPPTQSAILTTANQVFESQAGALAAQIAQHMKTFGIVSGIFNYQQQMMVQGNTHPMYLVWQMVIDSSGRPRYGDARIIPTVPSYEYASYTPLTVAATLPSTLSLPNAGNIVDYQVNAQMNQLTATQTVNSGGAFDPPFAIASSTNPPAGCVGSPGNVSCDPDYGLKCMINHASDPYSPASPNPANPNDKGCPVTPINGFTDFITLMNVNGASAGYLDYTRQLEPVYTTNPQGQRVAVVAVDVSSRVWQQGGQLTCTRPIFYPMSWPVGAGWLCVDNISGASHYLYENPVVPSGGGNTGVSAGTGTVLTDGSFITLSQNAPCGNYSPPAVPGNYILLYQYVSHYGYYYGHYGHANQCRETEYYFISDGNQYTYSSPGSTSYMFFGNYGSPYIVFMSGSRTFTATNAVSGAYTNTGTIGYEVRTSTDRYFVYLDGTYSLINHVPSVVQACGSGANSLGLSNTASPTLDPLCTNYTWTIAAPSGATAQSLVNTIIDPFHGQQLYDYTNDTVNLLPANQYIYNGPGTIAPITLQ